MIQYRYTRHQVPRASLPDVETDRFIFLIKNVSIMRATYQVRLLLFMATETGKKLVVRVPKGCQLSESFKSLKSEHANYLKVERV